MAKKKGDKAKPKGKPLPHNEAVDVPPVTSEEAADAIEMFKKMFPNVTKKVDTEDSKSKE